MSEPIISEFLLSQIRTGCEARLYYNGLGSISVVVSDSTDDSKQVFFVSNDGSEIVGSPKREQTT